MNMAKKRPIKYTVTVTSRKSIPNSYYGLTEAEVVHTEPFETYGQMNLWAQQWFKTLGVNRTDHQVGKHTIPAREYLQSKIGLQFAFNWTGGDNYQEFTEEKFDSSYYHLLDHMINRLSKISDGHETLFKWGVSFGCVEVMKQEYIMYEFYVKKAVERD